MSFAGKQKYLMEAIVASKKLKGRFNFENSILKELTFLLSTGPA